MAAAVVEDVSNTLLLKALECSLCCEVMQPPIVLCPTGHSICSRCYENLDCCPECEVSFGKITPDAYDGRRIYSFRCLKNCRSRQDKLSVPGNGFTYQYSCSVCEGDESLVVYKNALIPVAQFKKLKAEFKPQRNYSLESLTNMLLYPCDRVGCKELVYLADWEKHLAECKFRDVACPDKSCQWIGPIQSIAAHLTSPPDVANMHQRVYKPMITIFFGEPKSVDNPNECIVVGEKYGVKYVFGCKLFKFGSSLMFSVTQFGFADDKENDIIFEVKLVSAWDFANCRIFQFPVEHHTIDGVVNERSEELGSIPFLKDYGYFNVDGMLHVVVDFWRRHSEVEPDTVTLEMVIQLDNESGPSSSCGVQQRVCPKHELHHSSSSEETNKKPKGGSSGEE